MDKLFLVDPRAFTSPPKMSLLVEAKSKPASIIKQQSLLRTRMIFCWYITSNQQEQMLIQNLNRIVSKPNVTPEQILYCTADCIPIDLMF